MTSGTRHPAERTTDAAEPTLDLCGRSLGDYQVLRKLGQGGMGQVYLAEQLSLKRKVALKVLHPKFAADAKAIERFRREAMTLAQATHANIVQVYAILDHEGMQLIALEYVEGRNLKDYLARKGPPELPIALNIMRQVASALQRAGELGIIHRDIKPENILLTRKGEAKVADFGLARDPTSADAAALNLTQTGVTMGTPLYMSPEQVEGKPVDCRTDIYSFGVTCYCMFAGQPPFRGNTAFEVAVQHVNKAPPPLASVRPDLPEAVCAVVHMMMAKDPAQRYQTGRDLLRDIVRLRDGVGVTAAQTAINVEPVAVKLEELQQETTALPVTPPRRWLVAAAVVASLLLAGLIGAGLAWLEHRRDDGKPADDHRPADGGLAEAILQPNKREQALRTLVHEALDPKSDKSPEAFANCMALGLLYLDEYRLDEAEKLFTQLEAITQPQSLTLLGQVGKGIVLALRNKPQESNALFVKVFSPDPKFPWPGGKGKKGGQPFEKAYEKAIKALPVIRPFLDNDRARVWLGKARKYNFDNGLPEAQVPRFLVNRFPLESAGEARGK